MKHFAAATIAASVLALTACEKEDAKPAEAELGIVMTADSTWADVIDYTY